MKYLPMLLLTASCYACVDVKSNGTYTVDSCGMDKSTESLNIPTWNSESYEQMSHIPGLPRNARVN